MAKKSLIEKEKKKKT
nr:ribosomal protein S14 [Ceratopteris pteridoides]UWI72040.1 ribosomal protein S14 [Ceratopteris pteridoides]